ncbi:MAG: hypothetical protein ACI4AM_02460 [Muribaculaceae bacterium]
MSNVTQIRILAAINIFWCVLCTVFLFYTKAEELINLTIPAAFFISLLLWGHINFFKSVCLPIILLVFELLVIAHSLLLGDANIWYMIALCINSALCFVTTLLAYILNTTRIPTTGKRRRQPHVIIQLCPMAFIAFLIPEILPIKNPLDGVVFVLMLLYPISMLFLSLPLIRMICGTTISLVRLPLTIMGMLYAAFFLTQDFLLVWSYKYFLFELALFMFGLISMMRVKADIALDKRFHVKGRRLWRKFRRRIK